jgi:hypothetical protein
VVVTPPGAVTVTVGCPGAAGVLGAVAALDAAEVVAELVAGAPEAADLALEEQPVAATATRAPPARRAMRFRFRAFMPR